jgi:hypothetical protein
MHRLVESASGLRHLRWTREILATLEAHFEHDARLSPDERDRVLSEIIELRAQITALSAAVKTYRDFMERDRTRLRGMLRVGQYLEKTAPNGAERAEAEAIREGFDEVFANFEARERAPRKQALRAAIVAIRGALLAMEARLGQGLSAAFVESLYPALADGDTRVADGPDGDDDATG